MLVVRDAGRGTERPDTSNYVRGILFDFLYALEALMFVFLGASLFILSDFLGEPWKVDFFVSLETVNYSYWS